MGEMVAFVLVLDQPFGFSSGSTKSSSSSSSSRVDSAILSAAASNRSKKDSSRGKIRLWNVYTNHQLCHHSRVARSRPRRQDAFGRAMSSSSTSVAGGYVQDG